MAEVAPILRLWLNVQTNGNATKYIFAVFQLLIGHNQPWK